MSSLRAICKVAFALTTISLLYDPVLAEDTPSDPIVLRTGQAEDGYLPFLFPMGAPRRGIYAEIAERISDLTGIEIEWGVYPATRGRYLFERCKLHLEFGVSPSWYSDEERANSLFSIPFTSHTDALAYAGPDKGLDHIAVEGQPVLAVLGYRYPTFEFDERFDVDSERTMIRMLATGHAELGILQKTVGQYLAKDMGVEISFAQDVQSTDLSLRIHNCAAEHLPALNKAIAELKSSGEIDRIVERYLEPAQAKISP
ncbi:substrate-binding periplasmic protein [Roseibium sp.]|uniref:substrate-binding periplasmic protein n=2 Tax=Roseibium sp. TaxID=1936156 RepID=UPI003BAE2A09